jgi:hypothetical protein
MFFSGAVAVSGGEDNRRSCLCRSRERKGMVATIMGRVEKMIGQKISRSFGRKQRPASGNLVQLRKGESEENLWTPDVEFCFKFGAIGCLVFDHPSIWPQGACASRDNPPLKTRLRVRLSDSEPERDDIFLQPHSAPSWPRPCSYSSLTW